MSTLLLIPKSERSHQWIANNLVTGSRTRYGVEISRPYMPEIIEAMTDDELIPDVDYEIEQ